MQEEYIKLRCKPEEKSAISKAAAQEGRSLSNYLLTLAKRDIKTKVGIEMKNRIESAISEEMKKNDKVGAEPVSSKLILTLDEKVTFIERVADELDEHYWWEFDGNELTVNYIEEIEEAL